jgi:hypothetical protein
MLTFRTLVVSPLILVLLLSSAAFAQDRHVVPPADVANTVAAQVAAQDAQRALVRQVLTRPEVQDLAAGAGLNLDRAVASIDTMSPQSLSQAAAAAQQVNDALVGGASTITISTTTIIIILLIVILILVID